VERAELAELPTGGIEEPGLALDASEVG
jgi:hypothetical protein